MYKIHLRFEKIKQFTFDNNFQSNSCFIIKKASHKFDRNVY